MEQPNIKSFILALRTLVNRANEDGGKSYDELAERIRQHAADGMIEEALGYVPSDLENVSIDDPFKPLHHHGREGKRNSRLDKTPSPLVAKSFE